MLCNWFWATVVPPSEKYLSSVFFSEWSSISWAPFRLASNIWLARGAFETDGFGWQLNNPCRESADLWIESPTLVWNHLTLTHQNFKEIAFAAKHFHQCIPGVIHCFEKFLPRRWVSKIRFHKISPNLHPTPPPSNHGHHILRTRLRILSIFLRKKAECWKGPEWRYSLYSPEEKKDEKEGIDNTEGW